MFSRNQYSRHSAKELLNSYKTKSNKLYYQYAGHSEIDDDIGLTYMGARWMDNETGRFISSDPAQQDLNWYIYAGNNPTTMIDPSGMYYLGSKTWQTSNIFENFAKVYYWGQYDDMDFFWTSVLMFFSSGTFYNMVCPRS